MPLSLLKFAAAAVPLRRACRRRTIRAADACRDARRAIFRAVATALLPHAARFSPDTRCSLTVLMAAAVSRRFLIAVYFGRCQPALPLR